MYSALITEVALYYGTTSFEDALIESTASQLEQSLESCMMESKTKFSQKSFLQFLCHIEIATALVFTLPKTLDFIIIIHLHILTIMKSARREDFCTPECPSESKLALCV